MNKRGRELHRAVSGLCDQLGIGHELVYGGKHPHMVLVFQGRTTKLSMPSTPGGYGTRDWVLVRARQAIRGLMQNQGGDK